MSYVFLRSTEEVCKAVKFIEAKKPTFTEPHLCASISAVHLLCHTRIGSRRPTSCPHFSLTQVMLTLEDKEIKGFTWVIAPALTSLGYLLILLVAIFPFWVRLVNEESGEVFFSGLFENCFHIKCWKPRPLSRKEGWRQGLGRQMAGAGTGEWQRTGFNKPVRVFSLSLHSLGVKRNVGGWEGVNNVRLTPESATKLISGERVAPPGMREGILPYSERLPYLSGLLLAHPDSTLGLLALLGFQLLFLPLVTHLSKSGWQLC